VLDMLRDRRKTETKWGEQVVEKARTVSFFVFTVSFTVNAPCTELWEFLLRARGITNRTHPSNAFDDIGSVDRRLGHV